MKMEDIETFVEIIDNKGLLKASEKMFISQSTVSNRLVSLEQDLGIKLIDRSPGQKLFTLTKRGEEFLFYAREYVFLNDTIRQWSTTTPRERLKIGTIDSFSGPLLSNFYNEFTISSNYFLEISHHWTDRIFDLLENHHLDIGIVPRLFSSNNIVTEPIFQEEMILVSYDNLPSVVHIGDLNPSNEIFFDWGNQYVCWHNTWFQSSIRPKMIVDIIEPLFMALKIPNSWAIVPMSVANKYKHMTDMKLSHIKESPPMRIGYIASRLNQRNLKENAINQFRQELILYLSSQESIQVINTNTPQHSEK